LIIISLASNIQKVVWRYKTQQCQGHGLIKYNNDKNGQMSGLSVLRQIDFVIDGNV